MLALSLYRFDGECEFRTRGCHTNGVISPLDVVELGPVGFEPTSHRLIGEYFSWPTLDQGVGHFAAKLRPHTRQIKKSFKLGFDSARSTR
jgi:hypothetical protein